MKTLPTDCMQTNIKGKNRFDTDASRYAAYLETPEGRLRTDLTFANLQDFIAASVGIKPVRALDLGCGTGVAAVRLARLGIDVTLLDSSSAMLDLAKRAFVEAGVVGTMKLGEAGHLASTFSKAAFDIILCHNLLEYVDDPSAVLSGAVRVMRGSSAILSILVRNQAGEVLKTALQTGDLKAAEDTLAAQWGQESLYRGKVRLFTPEALEVMLRDTSLAVIARRGVRVLADYPSSHISPSAEYDRFFAFERKLGVRYEFFGVARYIQYLVRSNNGARKGDA